MYLQKARLELISNSILPLLSFAHFHVLFPELINQENMSVICRKHEVFTKFPVKSL